MISYRRIVLAAAALVAAMAISQGAHAWTCAPGKYSGRTWSVTKQLSGHSATLDVVERGGECVMRFRSPSAGLDEEWILTNRRLVQRELDAKGKVAREYAATLEVRGGVEGYYVDCGGKGCKADIDSRYFWRIRTPGKRIVYSVWGVAPDKQSDPKAKAKKRHEYTFTLTKK